MGKSVRVALLVILCSFTGTPLIFAENSNNSTKKVRHHIDLMWLGQQGDDFQVMPVGYHFSMWNFGPLSVGLAGASWALNPNVENSSNIRLLVLPVGLRVHSFKAGSQLYFNGSYSVGKHGDSVLMGMSLSWQNKE